MNTARISFICMILGIAASIRAAEPSVADTDFFEKKVRPLLVAKCYECHSSTALKLKGGLRLDSRAAMIKGGESGPAMIAGKPETSRLIRAVGYDDVNLQMPPKARLAATEVATLTEWIRLGAPWPKEGPAQAATISEFNLAKRKAAHWSWQPVRDPTPPQVKQKDWPRTSLDSFILAKLEQNQIKPAPPAEKRTLIRRANLDITGLPPTPNEIDAFLADTSPDAFAKVVDRLLASPHFGERWARHWLDLVRYAETRGHEFEPIIPNAWQYRDYVIRALNADVPYNAFVTEHIAGDLMPTPRLHPVTGGNESILGTGFWFLGEEVHSPVDIRADECDRLDNRLDVMSKTFLGLTVACARCHDHKFDAISQKDYYALTGFLISGSYRQTRFETAEQHKRAAATLALLRAKSEPELRRSLATALRTELPKLAAAVLIESAKDTTVFPPRAAEISKDSLVIVDYGRTPNRQWLQDGVAFIPVKRGQLRFGQTNEVTGVTQLDAAEFDPSWKSIRSIGQQEGSALGKWNREGRTLRTPEFILTGGWVHYLVRGGGRAYAAVNSHLIVQGPLHGAVMNTWKPGNGWHWVSHNLTAYKGHRLHVEISPSDDGDLSVACVVQSNAPASGALKPAGRPSEVELAKHLDSTLRELDAGTVSADNAALADWLVRHRSKLIPAEAPNTLAFGKLASDFAADAGKTIAGVRLESQLAPAMFEGSGADEFLLIRGSSRTPGPVVPRRFLEAIGGLQQPQLNTGGERFALARQMSDWTNPFTSRVAVNRVWHHLLGRGIVASVDNFGVMGEQPSHPELLDHLATRFTKVHGWSLKNLIREILLSNTWQMRSDPADAGAELRDAQNVLLHRANVRRLEGEIIRDSILAVSGRLNPQIGGAPVDIHLTAFMEGRGRPASGPLDGDGRRSLYTAVRRNFLSPMMLAFDTPIPFSTVGRRNISNVPAQALILMNDPFVVQQAEVWAKRALTQKAVDTNDRITQLYAAAFGRSPSGNELASARRFLDEQARERGCAPDDVRIWADYCHVLFNVKEFIFIN